MPASLADAAGTEKKAVGRILIAPLQRRLTESLSSGRTTLAKAVQRKAKAPLVLTPSTLGHFDPSTGSVHLPHFADPYVMAHGLGHAEIHESRLGRLIQNEATARAGMTAPALTGLGGGISGYVDERDGESHAKRDAAIIGAVHAPQLGYEAGASVIGGKLLRRAGATKADLSSYAKNMGKAYGTYALMPAASAINYGLGRAVGRMAARRDHEPEKKASVPTLAMDLASQAKHMGRLSTFAKRTRIASPEAVNATNAALAKFKAKPLPVAQLAPVAVQAPAAVARKATPAQAIDPMALPKHLAKTNPEQAIQAGRQYGAKVVGNASVLDRLSQMSFDKLSTDSLEDIESIARRGDILMLSPKTPEGGPTAFSRAYNAISQAIQGNDLTHSALYAGDGEVLDFRFQQGLKKRPLSELGSDVDVAVVRPRVSTRIKEKAVRKLEKALDRGMEYSTPQLFGTLARRFLGPSSGRVLGSDGDSKRLEQEICSTIIAKSFDHKIVPGVARNAVIPSDFLNSKRLKLVARFRNPNRGDLK